MAVEFHVPTDNIVGLKDDGIHVKIYKEAPDTIIIPPKYAPTLAPDGKVPDTLNDAKRFDDFLVSVPNRVKLLSVYNRDNRGSFQVSQVKAAFDDVINEMSKEKRKLVDASLLNKNAMKENDVSDTVMFKLPATAIQFIDIPKDSGQMRFYCAMPEKDEMDRFVIIEKEYIHGVPTDETGRPDSHKITCDGTNGVLYDVILDANFRRGFTTQLNYGDESRRVGSLPVKTVAEYYNAHAVEMANQGAKEAIEAQQRAEIADTMSRMTPEERAAYEEELLQDRLDKMTDEERQAYYAKVREEEVEQQKIQARPSSNQALHLRISDRFMTPVNGYFAVSVPDEDSANKRGVFFVGESQVYIAEKKTGEPMPGRYDVFFKDGNKPISYTTTNEDGTNKVSSKTPNEIVAKYEEAQAKGLTLPNVTPVAECVYDNDREYGF